MSIDDSRAGLAPEPVLESAPAEDATQVALRPVGEIYAAGEGAEPKGGAQDETPTGPKHADDTGLSWWHRDHPTFAALSGFYVGLIYAIIAPSIIAAVLAGMYGSGGIVHHLWLGVLILVVPLVLTIVPATRRFGAFMWVGLVSTLVVVGGVAALVLWYLVRRDG